MRSKENCSSSVTSDFANSTVPSIRSLTVPGLTDNSTITCNFLKENIYCGCTNHSESISLPQSPFPESQKYIPERRKTIVTFFVFVITVLLNHFVLAIITDIISRDPLPDLMHSLFPQSNVARGLADWFAFAGSIGTLICCCLFHKFRWIIARRLWYVGSLLMLMRAVSICVTHIPSSYQDSKEVCVDPSDEPNPSYSRLFSNFGRIFLTVSFSFFLIIHTLQMGLQVKDSGDRLFCGDMLFSGHTTTTSTCCFFLNYYMPHSLWPVKLVVISCCLVAMVGLVSSRAHYSVDVIMGYWISSILFSLYHAYCEVPHQVRTQTRPFRRLFIFWTMFEMERKVPAGRLPNQLEWPLPWPKRAVKFFENWNEQTDENWEGKLAKWLANHRVKLHM